MPNHTQYGTKVNIEKPLVSGFPSLGTDGFFVSVETGEIISGDPKSFDLAPQASVFVQERVRDVGVPSNYLEYIAKTYTHHERPKEQTDCKPLYMYGECNHGVGEQHHLVKVVRCGFEWCKTCGSKGSDVHKRRIARWWEKVMSLEKLGYLCVSTPTEIRDKLKSRDNLKKIRRYWVRKLKAEGFSKGVGKMALGRRFREFLGTTFKLFY